MFMIHGWLFSKQETQLLPFVALLASTHGLQDHQTCLHQAMEGKAHGGSCVGLCDWNWGMSVRSQLIGQTLIMWSISLQRRLGNRVQFYSLQEEANHLYHILYKQTFLDHMLMILRKQYGSQDFTAQLKHSARLNLEKVIHTELTWQTAGYIQFSSQLS